MVDILSALTKMPEPQYVEVGDGVGMVLGADVFGGSTTPVDAMLAYLHRELGWSLAEVIGATSRVPARVLGIDGRKGAIEPGYDADIAVLNPDLTIWATMIGGVWAYRSEPD